jgi:hypothetical protein
MNQNNRTDKRLPLQKECILANRSGSIETQTIDMSKIGLGVKTDRTLPFKKGCELAVVIPSMGKSSLAELMWTKKDFNNTTRLGLKFLLA